MRAYVFVAVVALFVSPIVVTAQAGGLVPCSGPDCTTASVVALVAKLMDYLIKMLGAIAAIALVYAGFKMVTSQGNENAWKSAKEVFGNVIIGIVIILSAWLVVDLILKGLTGKGLEEWSGDFSIVKDVSNTGSVNDLSRTGVNGNQYTDEEARAILERSHIGVNKTVQEGTSLQNINKATIADAIALKQACNCEVTITGGTESTGGHSIGTYSHGNGYKYDIRQTAELNSYIINNFLRAGTRSDGAALYRSSSGSIYAYEQDHWDVLVK